MLRMTPSGRSLSSWGRKAEGSHVLLKSKKRDSSSAAEWQLVFLEQFK